MNGHGQRLIVGGTSLLFMALLFFLLTPALALGLLHSPLEETLQDREAVTELNGEVRALRAQRDDQKAARDTLLQQVDALARQTADIQAKVDKLAAGADGTALTGQGLAITISDAPIGVVRSAGDYADINWFLVHDRDILQVINVLKGAGAQAIAINGVRVTAGMAVHCGGPAIYVQDIPLVPPFKVLAIGDADTMKTALTGREDAPAAEVYLEMMAAGLVFQIEQDDAIEIPAGDTTKAVQRAAHVN